MTDHSPEPSVRAESVLEAALALAQTGALLIPVNGKMPGIRNWPDNASGDTATLHCSFGSARVMNLGIVTGKRTGYLVVDVDSRSGGIENLPKAQLRYGAFAPGPRAKTGGGGDHFYFAYPEGVDHIPNRVALGDFSGIDIRGDHGFVVAPPSIHPNGTRYKWVEDLALGEIELPPLPEGWLNAILHGDNPKAALGADRASGSILEGRRNDTLFRRACALRRQGATRDEILTALREMNHSCVPPLEERELASIAVIARSVVNQGGGKP